MPACPAAVQNDGVRWSRLFDDLEAQLRAQERAELEVEIAERTRAEHGETALGDRLAADLGRPLRVQVRGSGILDGELTELGLDWMVLDLVPGGGPTARTALVPLTAVIGLWGLSGAADPHPGRHQRRLGLRHALRAVGRDRTLVKVTDVDGGQRHGLVDRVGRDHFDLREGAGGEAAEGGVRRPALSVPYSALGSVASSPGPRAE